MHASGFLPFPCAMWQSFGVPTCSEIRLSAQNVAPLLIAPMFKDVSCWTITLASPRYPLYLKKTSLISLPFAVLITISSIPPLITAIMAFSLHSSNLFSHLSPCSFHSVVFSSCPVLFFYRPNIFRKQHNTSVVFFNPSHGYFTGSSKTLWGFTK